MTKSIKITETKRADPEIGGFTAIMTYFSYLLLIAVRIHCINKSYM